MRSALFLIILAVGVIAIFWPRYSPDAPSSSTPGTSVLRSAFFPRAKASPSKMRQCTCEETATCEDEAIARVSSCFDECHPHLRVLGKSPQRYAECFADSKLRGFRSAELCLKRRLGAFCSPDTGDKFLEKQDHSRHLSSGYGGLPNPRPSTGTSRRARKTFLAVQDFYRCAERCTHRRMFSCLSRSACAVDLPQPTTFAKAMNFCAKNNHLAKLSLWNTCRCLVTEKKLTHLDEHCTLLVNSLYLYAL